MRVGDIIVDIETLVSVSLLDELHKAIKTL